MSDFSCCFLNQYLLFLSFTDICSNEEIVGNTGITISSIDRYEIDIFAIILSNDE